jgi:hypothetical protein
MESISVSRTVQRIQASMAPFLEVVLNPANARVRAPEACDFLAGNPQDPIVSGYVEALHARDRRQHALQPDGEDLS